MDNPFISVHRVEDENDLARRDLIKVSIKRTSFRVNGGHFLAWLVALGMVVVSGLTMWVGARGESKRWGANRGTTGLEQGAIGSNVVEVKRETIRALILDVMRKRQYGYQILHPLARQPEEKAVFDFTIVRQGEALRRLGDRYLASGNRPVAVQAYCKALSMNPRNRNVWQGIGQWYLRGADPEMAKLAFETAVRLGSTNAETLTQLASLYRQEGRLDEALNLWSRCRHVAGKEPLTDLNEGLGLIERGDYETAMPCLARYLETFPRDMAAARALAFAQSRAGQWAEARKTLKKALVIEPDSPVLHADAAAVSAHAWLAQEASSHLEKLAEKTSSAVAYYFMLSPAFSGFRRTEIGKRLESVLMVSSISKVVSPEELRNFLAADISPRFSLQLP